MPEADNDLIKILPNSLIAGRYQIKKPLGEGGMAYVFMAKDLKTDQNVAIKILRKELTNDEEFIRRFDSEARAVSSLSYSNIVKIFDVGIQNGMRYMVMEYIDGISLKELITKNEYIEWEVALPIAIQIGLALDHAHRNGVVHRDIKPHNILINRDFIAKVADFGIARAASSNTITLSGNKAFGSVHYFSPEQARGGIVGEQSDIYSMGILLYEMLTGKLPFDADTPVAIALKHVQERPIPPMEIRSDIPKGLNDIIMKCIQKDIPDRYASAKDLVEELDAFMVDPDGSYGHVNRPRDLGQTKKIQAVGRQSNYGKLREIEAQRQRHKRRKN